MCGVTGMVGRVRVPLEETIDAMTDTLAHRGPDDRGVYVDAEHDVAIGMRRLSIVDLEGGHQPMHTADGEIALVFNGEIYNAPELRRELQAKGHSFRTDHSDTEVLVEGYAAWGTDLFERLNGMFAVIIWDRTRRQVVVARDRTGKKPLYVADVGGGYVIGSELKAVLRCESVDRELDFAALEQYLSFDYIVGPRTPFRRIKKIPAAHWAVVTPDGYTPVRYWRPQFKAQPIDQHTLLERMDELLDDAVKRRMIADVPLGLFLSGGLDSTSVGYFMRRHSDDVHSFSIGFEDVAFDESEYSQLAADALGTKHHNEVLSQDRVKELVPGVAELMDEPIGDPSIFPTYLLSVFTRQHVKVALGGDGSDELLMGYNAYKPLKVAWQLDRPVALRRGTAGLARALPARVGSRSIKGVQFARTIDKTPAARLLAHLGSFGGDARSLFTPAIRELLPSSVFHEPLYAIHSQNGAGTLRGAQATVAGYLRGYLQEDILVKVDRASMAASLEVRAPFLDPRLVDFFLSVPPSMRMRWFTGKDPLRRLMRGRIPDRIIDRPKSGFGAPLDAWFRGPLAALVKDCLSPERLRAAGIFDPVEVQEMVRLHLSGEENLGQRIWLLTLFELWRERWAR
jgi:asparagine synthase (glutamine-hydrolysing)